MDYTHQGMGDTMCALLAQSLPTLPYVEALSVEDNSLGDAGLTPLLHAVAMMPALKSLNLSQVYIYIYIYIKNI